MKRKFSIKSFLALAIAVCMAATSLPLTVFAMNANDGSMIIELPEQFSKFDQNKDGFVEYVSIGDSLTAGYGMNGYYLGYDANDPYNIPTIGNIDGFSATNQYGFGLQIEGTYPYLLNNFFNGTDKTHWSSLDMSSMRPQEFVYMMKNGEWPIDQLVGDYYKNFLLQSRDTFISGIEDAEVISIKLGDYCFSSVISERIEVLLGGNDYSYGDQTTKWLFENFSQYDYLESYYNQFISAVTPKLTELLGDQYGKIGADVVDGLAYYVLSYILCYDEAIKEIRAINPDAQIIAIGMSNFFSGIRLELSDGDVLDFEDVFNVMIDLVNAHRATSGDSENAIFVEIPEFTLIVDEIVGGTVDESSVLRLLASLTSEFGLANLIVNTIKSNFDEQTWNTYGQLIEADVTTDNVFKGWMTNYLNRKDADPSNDGSMSSDKFTFLNSFKTTVANPIKDQLLSSISALYNSLASSYDLGEPSIETFEEEVAPIVDTLNPNDAYSQIVINAYTQISNTIGIYNSVNSIEPTVAATLGSLYSVVEKICNKPEAYSMSAITDALAGIQSGNLIDFVSNGVMGAVMGNGDIPEGAALLAYFYLRCWTAGGVLGHPGAIGNAQVYSAIIDAITNNYTGADYIDDYAKEIFALIEAYGPSILGAAFGWAENKGYLDGVKAFAGDVNVLLAKWETLVTEAGNDPAALMAAAKTISTDLATLIEKHGIDELSGLVLSYLKETAARLEPYAGKFARLLVSLIAAQGAEGLDKFYYYISESKNIDDLFSTDVDGDGKIDYVSLGASNVNGYGLNGYLPEGVTAENKNTSNVYGYNRCPEGSYTDLVRDYIESLGKSVDMHQMAISSMRAEELRVLLDENYLGDAYTAWRFYKQVNGVEYGWFAQANGSLAATREAYKTAITNADFISLDIGLNNFGVYLSNEIANPGWAGHDVSTLDPKYSAYYGELKNYILTNAPELAGYEDMIDTIAYAFLGFCQSFDASVEIIRQLNPTATIVVVPIQNMLPDFYAVLEGAKLPLGQILGEITNAANLYTAAISPFSTEYLYAADVRANGKQRVEYFLETIKNYNGDPSSVDSDMLDCANVYDNNFSIAGIVEMAIAQNPELAPVKKNALRLGYDAFFELMKYGAGLDTIYMDVVADYSTAEKAVGDFISRYLVEALFAGASGAKDDIVLPENFSEIMAQECGTSVEAIETVLAMGVRTSIGNSFYGHPNRAGHAELALAVIDALTNGTTGFSFSINYAEGVAQKLAALVQAYGADALKALLAYADSLGYFDGAKALKEAIETKVAEWTALIARAEGDINAIIEICNTVATELVTLLNEFDYQGAADRVVSFINGAVNVLCTLKNSFVNDAEELIKTYGTDAINAIVAYAESLGLASDAEAFKNALAAKLAEWTEAYNNVCGTPEKVEEFCKNFVSELAALIAEFNIETTVNTVITNAKTIIEKANAYKDRIVDAIDDLVNVYGPEAIEAIYNYVINLDVAGKAEDLVNAVKAKLAEWTKLIEDANGVPKLQHAAIKTIAFDIYGLVVECDIADKIALVVTYVEAASAYINSFEGNLDDALLSMVSALGPNALQAIYDYADALGLFDNAEALSDFIESKIAEWKALVEKANGDVDALAAATGKIASEICDYAKLTSEKIVTFVKGAAEIFTDYGTGLADALVLLAKNYGEAVLPAIYNFAVDGGYFDDAEALKSYIDANIERWSKMLGEAAVSAEDLKLACAEIAAELEAAAKALGLEEKAAFIAGLAKNAAKLLGATAEELAAQIAELIKTYGPDAVMLIIGYLDANGYIDLDGIKAEAGAIRDMVDTWITKLETVTCEQVATEIAQYLIDNGIVTAEEIEKVVAWAATAVAVYNELKALTAEQIIGKLYDLVTVYGNEAFDMIVDYLEANGYLEGLADKIEALKAQAKLWKAQYDYLVDRISNVTEEEIKALLTEVWNYLVANGYISLDNVQLVADWAETLYNFYNAEIAGKTKEELVNKIHDLVKAYGSDVFEKLYAYLEAEGYIEEYTAKAEALKGQIEEWITKYGPLFKELASITEEDIYAFAEEVWQYVNDSGIFSYENIKALITYFNEELDKRIDEIEATVADIIAKAEAAGKLAEEQVKVILAKIEELKSYYSAHASEKMNEMIEKFMALAVQSVYVLGPNDYYVAIGGNTAYGTGIDRTEDTYFDIVMDTVDFADGKNVATPDFVLGSMTELEKFESEIVKATLITYQQDADALIYAAINTNAPDWSKYLNEEQLGYANKIIADAKALLAENVGTETAAILAPIIENAAYGVVTSAYNAAAGIEYINSVNEDVTIILVGMYNPVRGLKVNVNGEIIDLGELFENIIDVANLYGMSLTSVYDNVIFADISEAETNGFDTVIDVQDLNLVDIVAMLRGNGMYANANGHKYIYNQIMNYIEVRTLTGNITSWGEADGEVTVVLKDANGNVVDSVVTTDGSYEIEGILPGEYTLEVSKLNHRTRIYDVTVSDTSLAMPVEIWLIGDVNGDGVVTSVDSQLAYNDVIGIAALEDYPKTVADTDLSGTISAVDVQSIFNHVAKTVVLWK